MDSRAWLIVDWGGTVMEDDPDATGPMTDWPQVAAVPGAREALRRLAGRTRLALATGALDSDAAAVRRALSRVACEELFETVLTGRELGVGKPDPEFFRRALHRLGAHAGAAAAIGDDLARDARPALAAGMAAVWLNRGGPERPREPRLVGVGDWEGVEEALAALGMLPDGS